MKAKIQERFELNMRRVRNLVAIYRNLLAGEGQGRRGHQETDVLRAAVVLLHASLEDVLRSLAYWRLPLGASEALEGVPLAQNGTSTKFHLGSLANHRGKTVDQLIKESVDASLERSNYNNPDEVVKLLTSINLNPSPIRPFLADIEGMMSRRHQIVHRADANSQSGKGQHRVASIKPATLEAWVGIVEQFVSGVLDQV